MCLQVCVCKREVDGLACTFVFFANHSWRAKEILSSVVLGACEGFKSKQPLHCHSLIHV